MELLDRAMPFLVAVMAFSCFTAQSGVTVTFAAGLLYVAHKAWRHGFSSLIGLPGMNLALAIYATSFVVSCFVGIDPHLSSPFITELKRILVAYVVANSLTTRRDVLQVFGAIAIAATLSTGYALYQHYVGGIYRTLKVTQYYPPGKMVSSFAFSSTSNDFGAVIGTAFGLFAGPFLFSPMSRRQRFVLGLLTCWFGVGVLRSGCRSALVGAVTGIVALGAILNPRRVLVVMLVFALLVPVLPKSLTYRFPKFFGRDNPSNRFRIRMAEASVEMMRLHLPMGIGRHNFDPLFHSMHPTELRTPNAHNNYLNVLVEQGVGGLIGLVWFQVALAVYIYRRLFSGTEQATWFAGLAMALWTFTVAGISIFDWGYSMPVTLMWLLVGTAVAIGERHIGEQSIGEPQASILENK